MIAGEVLSALDLKGKFNFAGLPVNGCQIKDGVFYANEEDADLGFARNRDIDVDAIRSKGNHDENVALKVACKRDNGVQCGKGMDCSNYILGTHEFCWELEAHPDSRRIGVKFMGADERGLGEIAAGKMFWYGGVYRLERGIGGLGDSSYLLELVDAHKVNGQSVYIDASVVGSLLTRCNTADIREPDGNNFMLDHIYIDGGLVVGVVRSTKAILCGQTALVDYVGDGNKDMYGSMVHNIYKVARKRGSLCNVRLDCTHHEGPKQKQVRLVCMECGWQPVCESCFGAHKLSPIVKTAKKHFKNNQAWKNIFDVPSTVPALDMSRMKFFKVL